MEFDEKIAIEILKKCVKICDGNRAFTHGNILEMCQDADKDLLYYCYHVAILIDAGMINGTTEIVGKILVPNYFSINYVTLAGHEYLKKNLKRKVKFSSGNF